MMAIFGQLFAEIVSFIFVEVIFGLLRRGYMKVRNVYRRLVAFFSSPVSDNPDE